MAERYGFHVRQIILPNSPAGKRRNFRHSGPFVRKRFQSLEKQRKKIYRGARRGRKAPDLRAFPGSTNPVETFQSLENHSVRAMAGIALNRMGYMKFADVAETVKRLVENPLAQDEFIFDLFQTTEHTETRIWISHERAQGSQKKVGQASCLSAENREMLAAKRRKNPKRKIMFEMLLKIYKDVAVKETQM